MSYRSGHQIPPPLYRQSECNVRQRAASFVSSPVHHEQTAACGDLQTGERCVLWVSQSVSQCEAPGQDTCSDQIM